MLIASGHDRFDNDMRMYNHFHVYRLGGDYCRTKIVKSKMRAVCDPLDFVCVWVLFVRVNYILLLPCFYEPHLSCKTLSNISYWIGVYPSKV